MKIIVIIYNNKINNTQPTYKWWSPLNHHTHTHTHTQKQTQPQKRKTSRSPDASGGSRCILIPVLTAACRQTDRHGQAHAGISMTSPRCQGGGPWSWVLECSRTHPWEPGLVRKAHLSAKTERKTVCTVALKALVRAMDKRSAVFTPINPKWITAPRRYTSTSNSLRRPHATRLVSSTNSQQDQRFTSQRQTVSQPDMSPNG